MKETRWTKIHWGRFAGWAVLFLIAAWFFSKIYFTLTVFTIAILIAYILNPIVTFVSNIKIPILEKKIPWFLSILVVYFLLIGFLVISGIVLLPSIMDQINNVVADTPTLVAKMQRSLESLEKRYQKFDIPPEFKGRLDEFITRSTEKIGNLIGTLFRTVGTLILNCLSWLLFLLLSMIIALFVLANESKLIRGFFSIIPPDYQDDVRELLDKINNIFGNYVRGNLILMATNGILTYLALLIIPFFIQAGTSAGAFPFYHYALVTSVIAGLTYFIPYLGCSLSVIVALALSYLQLPSLKYSVSIGLIVLLTNQSVDSFLKPKILGEALGVNTLFIVFTAIAGSELLGVWGLLLGIPAGVMIVSIVQFIYNRFLAFPVSEEVISDKKIETGDKVAPIMLEPQLQGTEFAPANGPKDLPISLGKEKFDNIRKEEQKENESQEEGEKGSRENRDNKQIE